MDAQLYKTPEWAQARAAALERDRGRCTVSRLLGGDCGGLLHVHHIVPVSEGGARFDVDNLGSACARHHARWEALRRQLVRSRERAVRRRCPHVHRSREAREICERQRALRRAA